ncbi:flavin reductase family protein [Sporosarcina saromensis]|uniref:Flavin reductase family protein n=1 Tax=Sporosarcina saromensis TaxID=359365 RepID=A0ABU4GB90_9BACL|nr:flavin reductase family protein [Sporosarcina saromensis]MDW0114176.1 flavin reductase family protein [Sporosarcina saromensis]
MSEVTPDVRELRNCFGRFATGVTVVTCEHEKGKHGFTVNSFTSVSLQPPLVLVSVDRRTRALPYLQNNSFTINILRASQQDTAMHFAGRPLDVPPFEWDDTRIKDSLAYIECEPWAEYDGGDHVLFVGKVKRFEYEDGAPLGYYGGKFSTIEPL